MVHIWCVFLIEKHMFLLIFHITPFFILSCLIDIPLSLKFYFIWIIFIQIFFNYIDQAPYKALEDVSQYIRDVETRIKENMVDSTTVFITQTIIPKTISRLFKREYVIYFKIKKKKTCPCSNICSFFKTLVTTTLIFIFMRMSSSIMYFGLLYHLSHMI